MTTMRIDTIQELALATGLTCGAIRHWAKLAGRNAEYNPDHVDRQIHEKARTSGWDCRTPVWAETHGAPHGLVRNMPGLRHARGQLPLRSRGVGVRGSKVLEERCRAALMVQFAHAPAPQAARGT